MTTPEKPRNVNPGRRVVLKPRWWANETPAIVFIDDDGAVRSEDGTHVGFVKRGTRTYSPPTHRGSRIVRYHKQVSEWHGWYPASRRHVSPDVRADSRVEVIRRLLDAR